MEKPFLTIHGGHISGFQNGGLNVVADASVEVHGELIISHTGGHGVSVGEDLYARPSGFYGIVAHDYVVRNNKHSTIEDLGRIHELISLPSLGIFRDDTIAMLTEIEQELTKVNPDTNLIHSLFLAVNNFICKYAEGLADSDELYELKRRVEVRLVIAPWGKYK